MSGVSSAGHISEDRAIEPALAGFFEDFDALLALEARIAPFNLFEALDMQRAEVRHSQFLAYILDPARPHGLADAFLKQFLYRALLQVGSNDPLPAEAMILDLDGARIERERENIDLLITLEHEHWVIAIENKVDAAETGDQLIRYHHWVVETYGEEWTKIFLFLSPDARRASHEIWQAISYQVVIDALEQTLASRQLAMGEDVALALRHYHEMLERHVCDHDKNREIARKLYHKHREVFDFVFAALPQMTETILAACMDAVAARDDMRILNNRSFAPLVWSSGARKADNVMPETASLYFEISPASETVIILYLGPGEPDTRASIHARALSAGAPLDPRRELTPQWTYLLKHTLVSSQETSELPAGECAERAAHRLNRFLDENLEIITRALIGTD